MKHDKDKWLPGKIMGIRQSSLVDQSVSYGSLNLRCAFDLLLKTGVRCRAGAGAGGGGAEKQQAREWVLWSALLGCHLYQLNFSGS